MESELIQVQRELIGQQAKSIQELFDIIRVQSDLVQDLRQNKVRDTEFMKQMRESVEQTFGTTVTVEFISTAGAPLRWKFTWCPPNCPPQEEMEAGDGC